MRSMWRRRGKDASPFGKASCSEPRTHMLPGVRATSMRLSPNWLLTGLAVVFSRPNWQFLAKRGTLTATPQHLLRSYYRRGYLAGLVDKKAMPYVIPWHNALSEAEWQRRVRWFCHSRYYLAAFERCSQISNCDFLAAHFKGFCLSPAACLAFALGDEPFLEWSV